MSKLDRGALARAFPNNPRIIADFESLDGFLSDFESRIADVKDQIAALGEGGQLFQTASPLLEAIAAMPNRLGAIEVAADGQANIRPIDAADPASLLTRGVSYTILVGIAGRGATAARPVLPDNAVAIYFDTDLNKPILWSGPTVGWRDFTGAAV
jgi:hypothetical protein